VDERLILQNLIRLPRGDDRLSRRQILIELERTHVPAEIARREEIEAGVEVRKVSRQLLVRLHAEKIHIFHRAHRGQVDARLLPADPDEAPLRMLFCGKLHKVVLDAGLQRAHEAKDRAGNALHVLGQGLRLRSLEKAFEVGAVRDEIGSGVGGSQPVGQGLRRGKDHVGLPGQLQLHLVDQRRIHESAVGRVPVHAVVDERGVRDAVDRVDRHGRVDPEHGLFHPVLRHLFLHERGDLLLIDPVDAALFIEKRQHGRQRVDRDVLLHLLAGQTEGLHERPRVLVAQRGDDGRGRVEIEDLRVRDAAHHLLLAGGDGVPRRGGETDDFFHVVSSKRPRATSSFSFASSRRWST